MRPGASGSRPVTYTVNPLCAAAIGWWRWSDRSISTARTLWHYGKPSIQGWDLQERKGRKVGTSSVGTEGMGVMGGDTHRQY